MWTGTERTAVYSPRASGGPGLVARRADVLRRLAAQAEEVRAAQRRVQSESTLLAALEEARPLTRAERARTARLREEMRGLFLDVRRLRGELAQIAE
ncbi:MAG TPA: hypothetical protein VFX49_21110 [Chloroflexota bacterium]|nr:hypothetical protein [Chloroflexota bacterium]